MKYLALLLTFGFGLSGFGQTIKSLGYNSTNGRVVANVDGLSLQFTNSTVEFQTLAPNNIQFSPSAEAIIYYDGNDYLQFGNNVVTFWRPLTFDNTTNAATTRANLGFSTNLSTLWTATNASNARSAVGLGATWLTNTNVTNFRTDIGLGVTNSVILQSGTFSNSLYIGQYSARIFSDLGSQSLVINNGTNYWTFDYYSGNLTISGNGALSFNSDQSRATTRTNLGLGGGITTNRTFVSYNGTNYTTNTVTISNGIITGWTQ